MNFLLKNKNWRDIALGLESNLSGYITRYKVLPWLKKNEAQLQKLGLLDKALQLIRDEAQHHNSNLQKLEIDSFDPTHEYYGGKVQYET